jgi:hypothetical protein
MKARTFIVALLVCAWMAASIAPPASADPLTIFAVIGVVTVLSAASFDMVARTDDDNRDMRAGQEETARLQARVDASPEIPAQEEGRVTNP